MSRTTADAHTTPSLDRQIEASQAFMPFAGLAVSIALALAVGPGADGPSRTVFTAAVLGLSAAAALWSLFVRVPFAEHEARTAQCFVFCGVLLVLIASLILLSPFFAFFGIIGYQNAMLLPGRWKLAAMGVTACLETAAQLGGIHNLHGETLTLYGPVLLANITVITVIFRSGIREEERSETRARMIDELAEANRRLELSMEENTGLHAQLVVQAREAGVLDERRRMAGEIHDTLAQGLAGIIAQLEAADLADGDPVRHRRHLNLARGLARDSLAEARRSVQALRPGPLDDARLPEALTQLAEQWKQTSGIPVRMEVDGTPTPLQPALEVALFRAAQEALANIARHSGASRAGMTLTYTHDVVALDVLDDGTGFEVRADAGTAGQPNGRASTLRTPADQASVDDLACGTGYGLAAMSRRLRQVGGGLVIESAPGDGTTLSASVPAWGIEDDA